MAISLYDVSVASYLQILGGVSGFLERGLSHCEENGIDPVELVQTRLYPDMLPFSFQIQSVSHHSLGAIEGVMKGVFAPPGPRPEPSYKDLQTWVADTQAALEKLTPAEVDAFAGRDVVFQAGERRLPFTAEDFLLSFSLPNFYFHATTAYDILRSKGVPLGKRDFTGRPRLKA
jgi:uncharacterized protein